MGNYFIITLRVRSTHWQRTRLAWDDQSRRSFAGPSRK
ncbi:MAG: hypothetical protein D6754_15455 [Alphaproteobacteria bacterium]|nr:MAG: hypothetical protein D6754_15455 [Alphaproteobacteria bacterium]